MYNTKYVNKQRMWRNDNGSLSGFICYNQTLQILEVQIREKILVYHVGIPKASTTNEFLSDEKALVKRDSTLEHSETSETVDFKLSSCCNLQKRCLIAVYVYVIYINIIW